MLLLYHARRHHVSDPYYHLNPYKRSINNEFSCVESTDTDETFKVIKKYAKKNNSERERDTQIERKREIETIRQLNGGGNKILRIKQ